MSRKYLVSRHKSAIAWIKAREPDVIILEHLDTKILNEGDIVIGTLPVHIVFNINELGVIYKHLILDLKAEDRGRELSMDEMDQLGARLEIFEVIKRPA